MENKKDNLNKEIKNHSVKSSSKQNIPMDFRSRPARRSSFDNFKKNTVSDLKTESIKKEKNIPEQENNNGEESGSLLGSIARNIGAESKGAAASLIENDKKDIYSKKKKTKKNLIIIIIFFILITGSAAAYFVINNQQKNEVETPQQIIEASLEATNKVKSYFFDGSLNFDLRSSEETFFLDMKFNGETEEDNSGNVKSFFRMNPKIDIMSKSLNDRFNFDCSIMSFEDENEDDFYLKLNDLNLGKTSSYDDIAVLFKNNWYSLNLIEIQNDYFGIDEEYNPYKIANDFKDVFSKSDIIKFKDNLGDTRINGIDLYHYQVVIYLEDIINSSLMRGGLNTTFNNIEAEIWIGKEDKMIYKLVVDAIDDSVIIGNINASKLRSQGANNASLSFNLIFEMSDFNKAVSFNKPDEAIDLMKIIESIVALNDTDKDGLDDKMEEIYGTDKNNPDTDGDGYLDGEEVKNGYDPTISGGAKLDYDNLLNK